MYFGFVVVCFGFVVVCVVKIIMKYLVVKENNDKQVCCYCSHVTG